jgi:hypothetical protein
MFPCLVKHVAGRRAVRLFGHGVDTQVIRQWAAAPAMLGIRCRMMSSNIDRNDVACVSRVNKRLMSTTAQQPLVATAAGGVEKTETVSESVQRFISSVKENPRLLSMDAAKTLQSYNISLEMKFQPTEFCEMLALLEVSPALNSLRGYISWIGNASTMCVSREGWSAENIMCLSAVLRLSVNNDGIDKLAYLLAEVLKSTTNVSIATLETIFENIREENKITSSTSYLLGELAAKLQQRSGDAELTDDFVVNILSCSENKITAKVDDAVGLLVQAVSELIYNRHLNSKDLEAQNVQINKGAVSERLLLAMVSFVKDARAVESENRSFLRVLSKLLTSSASSVFTYDVLVSCLRCLQNKSSHFEEVTDFVHVVNQKISAEEHNLRGTDILKNLRHCTLLTDDHAQVREFFRLCASLIARDSEACVETYYAEHAIVLSAFKSLQFSNVDTQESNALAEVLLQTLEKISQRSKLSGTEAMTVLSYMGSMLSDHPTTRKLLRFVTSKIEEQLLTSPTAPRIGVITLEHVLSNTAGLPPTCDEMTNFLNTLNRFSVSRANKHVQKGFDGRQILQCQQRLRTLSDLTADKNLQYRGDVSDLKRQIDEFAKQFSSTQAPQSVGESDPSVQKFANKYESIIFRIAEATFQDAKNVVVSHNEVLFNHESDIVLRVFTKGGVTGSPDTCVILNVELDGGSHYHADTQRRCKKRDMYLKSQGVHVVRWNISSDAQSTFGKLNERNNFALVAREFRSLVLGVPDGTRQLPKLRKVIPRK